jgi:alkylhydroperoxidase family enzyme
MKRFVLTAASVLMLSVANAHADEQPSDIPKPIPATRPEMKAALEALKERQPRLPLPDADGQGGVNNGRMRATYLPESWGRGGRRGRRSTTQRGRRDGRSGFGRRGQDPNSTMDYAFTTSLFWITSRGNNCYYCLGHQELKLRRAGLDDDTIASLDSDWSRFDPRQQAALGYARRLTLEPQLVGDDEIAALKQLFTDAEIVQLTFNIARFNATNRWTDGMGLPQDRRFGDRENTLTTPTSEAFQNTVSIVSPDTRAERPKPPTMDEVNSVLSSLSGRTARVELPSEEEARKALSGVIGDRPPLAWECAMAAVPGRGPSQVATLNTIMSDEHLPLRLKAELSLITAANDRAWYSLGHAIHRLRALGVTNDGIATLLNPSAGSPNPAHRLAAKSTANPHLVTDADIASVRDNYSDSETAQIMHVICMANMFDRFTQALGLPLEPSVAGKTPLLP